MKIKSLVFLLIAQLCSFSFMPHECRAEEAVDSYYGARFKEGKGIEVSAETKKILSLETVEVEEEQKGSQTIVIVPASSLLRTVTGTYVYVANGNHFLRTPVATGKVDQSSVQITDGLLEGDEVVTKPVNSLWYVELQALRGGKACADGH